MQILKEYDQTTLSSPLKLKTKDFSESLYMVFFQLQELLF